MTALTRPFREPGPDRAARAAGACRGASCLRAAHFLDRWHGGDRREGEQGPRARRVGEFAGSNFPRAASPSISRRPMCRRKAGVSICRLRSASSSRPVSSSCERKTRESALAHVEFYGELALSGELKSVRGMLLAAAQARTGRARAHRAARQSGRGAHRARGSVCGASHLLEVCGILPARRASSQMRRSASRRHCPPSRRSSTCRTFVAKRRPSARWRSPPAGGHSLLMSARRAPARACWRSACPVCCRR